MPVKIDAEVRIAASRQNQTAGRLVRTARTEAALSQGDFGGAIGRRLGLVSLSQSAVSDWENGKRQVPAAAVIAAAEVARISPAELFSREAKRQTQTERVLSEIERLTGGLTPRQRERLRALDGGKP